MCYCLLIRIQCLQQSRALRFLCFLSPVPQCSLGAQRKVLWNLKIENNNSHRGHQGNVWQLVCTGENEMGTCQTCALYSAERQRFIQSYGHGINTKKSITLYAHLDQKLYISKLKFLKVWNFLDICSYYGAIHLKKQFVYSFKFNFSLQPQLSFPPVLMLPLASPTSPSPVHASSWVRTLMRIQQSLTQ